MKKFISLFLCIMTCFLCSSCNYIKYAQYPKMEYDNEYWYYQGQRYKTVTDFDLEGFFMVYDHLEIVGRHVDFCGRWAIDYFSNRDTNKNWLSTNGQMSSYANAFKVGFELPSFNSPSFDDISILEIRIVNKSYLDIIGSDKCPDIGLQVDGEDYVIPFCNEDVSFGDIFDKQQLYTYNIPRQLAQEGNFFYFILKEHPYIAWGDLYSVIVYEDEIYIYNCVYKNLYKINPEYQEVFRNAIEELNA